MSNGFNISEEGHPVVIFPPASIAGGITTLPFHMKWAEHVSIVIDFGAEGGSPPQLPGAIGVYQATSASGAGAIALGSFRYYFQSLPGAGNDVLVGPYWTSSPSGIVFGGVPGLPASVAGLQFIIELDAAEVESITCSGVGPQVEYPYVVVTITNGAAATVCSISATLTGLRGAEKASYSVTT